MLGTVRGSTRPHFLEKSFWNRLWTCRKTDYRMNDDSSEHPVPKYSRRNLVP
jgi:hypothetical protein